MLTTRFTDHYAGQPGADAERWGLRCSPESFGNLLAEDADQWTRFQVWGSTVGFNGQPCPVANTLVERDGHDRPARAFRLALFASSLAQQVTP